MAIQCQVIEDGQIVGAYSFASVPRVGEWITIAESGEAVNLIVEYVEHGRRPPDDPGRRRQALVPAALLADLNPIEQAFAKRFVMEPDEVKQCAGSSEG